MKFSRLIFSSILALLGALLLAVFVNNSSANVSLLYFRGTAGASSISLEWATATELNTFGFYILRATSASGEFTQIGELIQATGSDAMGADYSFTDNGPLQTGTTYYYKLREIEFDNSTNDYETINVPYGVVSGVTNTVVSPTNTSVPPTNTSVPPTSTRIPSTNTSVPSTHTRIPPTNTAVPVNTTQQVVPTAASYTNTPFPSPTIPAGNTAFPTATFLPATATNTPFPSPTMPAGSTALPTNTSLPAATSVSTSVTPVATSNQVGGNLSGATATLASVPTQSSATQIAPASNNLLPTLAATPLLPNSGQNYLLNTPVSGNDSVNVVATQPAPDGQNGTLPLPEDAGQSGASAPAEGENSIVAQVIAELFPSASSAPAGDAPANAQSGTVHPPAGNPAPAQASAGMNLAQVLTLGMSAMLCLLGSIALTGSVLMVYFRMKKNGQCR